MPRSLARLRLDRSRPVAFQVHDHLRSAIVSLDLAPGSSLSRTDLGETFGVSSTPLRDALLRLEKEGLVDVFPQHATYVSRIDLGAARQAHVLRRSVELEVVSILAERADRSLVTSLRAMLARQAVLQEGGELDRLAEADTGFHAALCEAAGVRGLWSVVRRESGHLDRLRNLHLPEPGKADAILAEHGIILDTIASGNVAAARAAIRRHLSDTLAAAEELRARHPAFFDPPEGGEVLRAAG